MHEMWSGAIRLEQQSVDKMYFDLLDRWGYTRPKYDDNPDDYARLLIDIHAGQQAMIVQLYGQEEEDAIRTWEEWAQYMDEVLLPMFDPFRYG